MAATQPNTEFAVYRLKESADKDDPLSGDDKMEFSYDSVPINISNIEIGPYSPPAETDNPTSQEPNFKEDVGVSKVIITIHGHIDMRENNSKEISQKAVSWLTQEKENENYKVGRFGFYSKNDLAEYNLIPGTAKGYTLTDFTVKMDYAALGKKEFAMILELGAGVASLGEPLPSG